MNTIKIITEFCEEDRIRIDGLTGAVSLLATVLGNALDAEKQKVIAEGLVAPLKVPTDILTRAAAEIPGNQPPVEIKAVDLSGVDTSAPLEPVTVEEETPEPAEETPAPAEETPAPVEETPEPTPEVKPVSLPEFQKAVTQAVAKGAKQKAAAKEIINKYAASVSAVPEDKRAEVMAELAKI